MIKNSTLLLLLGFLGAGNSFAQKQADWWYFGLNAGVDFTSGSPVAVINGALSSSAGCSSISDTSGQLLFYTDGITVYTKQNTAMPNSGDLAGNSESTQSALIVPTPGNSTLYYIFTLDAIGGPNGFEYSLVDLTLNGGLGDVTTKNVPLKNNVTEKLSAVSNSDGSGYWVMIHEWGNNAFDAYRVTGEEIDTNAVVSHVGTVHNTTLSQNTIGQMKFSPNGKKVAVAIGYQGIFELFDFDDATGIVSNPVTITTGDRCYGVEFSADNSRLYVTHYDPFFELYYLDQYDISSGDEGTIIESKLNLYNSQYEQLRALQLGPDKKIYVAKAFTTVLGVINNPDSAGVVADYEGNGVNLDYMSCALGLPGFVQSYFRGPSLPIANFGVSQDTICQGTCINFTDSSSDAQSYLWIFNGGIPHNSTDKNPSHICFDTVGTYFVLLSVSNAFGHDTAGKWIEVDACTGIEDVSKSSVLNISPNPASDKIFLDMPANKTSAIIQITNTLGEIIFSEKIIPTVIGMREEIDVSRFPKGIYLVTLKTSSQSFGNKFLKR